MPQDVVACADTKQLYVSDGIHICPNPHAGGSDSVWRVTMDSGRAEKWLTSESIGATSPRRFNCSKLSLSYRRLLVLASQYLEGFFDELFLFGLDGVLLKRISLAEPATGPCHAVETSRGTFVACCSGSNQQVFEVDADGHVIRVTPNRQQFLGTCYLALAADGRMLVVDCGQSCVLLLNSELELERVLIDVEHNQLAGGPTSMCYVEKTNLVILVVNGKKENGIQTFHVGDL